MQLDGRSLRSNTIGSCQSTATIRNRPLPLPLSHHITDITQWLIWLITSKFETFNFDSMIDFTVNSWIKIEHFSFLYHVTVERVFAHFCHQNYRFGEETWEINSNNIVHLCSSRLVQCYLLLFKIISIYNWSKVGIAYCKMGDSKNLPRWAAQFGKMCSGKLWALLICQWKTVSGPILWRSWLYWFL